MVFFSPYRDAVPQTLLSVISAALLALSVSCGPSRPVLSDTAAPYHPVSIASGVASRPGAMAWSPDGKHLAYISSTVTIVDVTGKAPIPESIPIGTPRYLEWADDGTLLVLSRERDQDVLVLIDAARTGVIRKALDRRADAVYAADHQRLLLLSLEVTRLKFGTEIRWTLSRLDLPDGTLSVIYHDSRIAPAGIEDRDLLTAWALAGLNPLDGSFLIMELVKPPALPPYSRVRAFDPASGDLAEIGSQDRRAICTSAVWSPDGRKIALTGLDGFLHVRDLRGGSQLDIAAPGLYPAWQPAGDLVAVGGSLVSMEAGKATQLLQDSSGSLARWSPDGSRLAVIAEGKLLLFRDIRSTAGSSARPDRDLRKRLALLQELVREDLITREEYRTRRSRLLEDKKGGKP